MLMVCNTFDWEDYPVYVNTEENLEEYILRYQNLNQMSKIMEIYNYDINLEYQLNEQRAWHEKVDIIKKTRKIL